MTWSLPPSRWFTGLALLAVDGEQRLVTGDEETCALLLSGTYDLQGGGTAWQSRGARSTPFAGRPVAVFLPPRTPFVAHGGPGEILLVRARQPDRPPESTGRAALSQKPLLPLAGSGKAFDPGTGEWRPAETFPTAAESLPPRRLQQLRIGDVVVERVFARDYKAATLSVDEVVLPPGIRLDVAAIPERPDADELLLFVRAPAGAALICDGVGEPLHGDACRLLSLRDGPDEVSLRALAAPVYAVLAFAGKQGERA